MSGRAYQRRGAPNAKSDAGLPIFGPGRAGLGRIGQQGSERLARPSRQVGRLPSGRLTRENGDESPPRLAVVENPASVRDTDGPWQLRQALPIATKDRVERDRMSARQGPILDAPDREERRCQTDEVESDFIARRPCFGDEAKDAISRQRRFHGEVGTCGEQRLPILERAFAGATLTETTIYRCHGNRDGIGIDDRKARGKAARDQARFARAVRPRDHP